MPTTKWLRHPDVPAGNCVSDKDGSLLKMQVREWAVAKVIAKGMVNGEGVASTMPQIAPSSEFTSDWGRIVMEFRTGEAVVYVYARSPGSAILQTFGKNNPIAGRSGPLLNVEVLKREAPTADKISLTTLMGRTVAINSHDAQAYEMEKTLTFKLGSDPTKIFVDVPVDTDHVVVSSHGGIPHKGDPDTRLCMFVNGFTTSGAPLDIDNCEAAFKVLKGKVSVDAVIWLGGCNIGANNAFCSKAAIASGCRIVAPAMQLPAKKFPKGQIDLLDRFARSKVFGPDGKLMGVSDLCAIQFYYKFKLPI